MNRYTINREIKYIAITFVQGKITPIRLNVQKKGLKSFYYWLERNYPQWTAINIYNKYTTEFVVQLRKDNYFNKIQSL